MAQTHRYRELTFNVVFDPAPVGTATKAEQVARMVELRELTNEIALAYRERDELIRLTVDDELLLRRDAAFACGLAESRVNQIAREDPKYSP
ncbi:MAG: hypothetical protein Q7T73_22470 [Beijerinckiaceae bacterium]|nr:hypothetical protein [Beijerinckiaceae bacterium]